MTLFLNDIAASEVVLMFFFILMFFGSKSIPGIARTMGRTIRQIKQASDEVQSEIKKSGMDIKKDMNLSALIEDTAKDLKQPLDQMAQDMDQAMNNRSVNGYTKFKKEQKAVEASETEKIATPLPDENKISSKKSEKDEI